MGLSEFQAKNIARQLCEAVAFLNALGLTHTDLKTENIVLETKEASITDPDVKIKLIDLGCASWGGGGCGHSHPDVPLSGARGAARARVALPE